MITFFIPAEQTLKVFDPLIDQKVQKMLFDVTFIRTQIAFFFTAVVADTANFGVFKAKIFKLLFTETFT
jgi:hypothetical protein